MMNDYEKIKNKKNFLTMLMMIVFFVTNISYMPFFTTLGLTQYLSYPIWGGLILALIINRGLFLSDRDKNLIFYIFSVSIIMMLLEMGTGKVYISSLLTRCIMIALFISFIGEMVSRTGKTHGREKKFFLAYIIATVIVSIVVYFQYLRGQDINSSLYVYGSKNELAFLMTSAIVMLLYMDQICDAPLGKIKNFGRGAIILMLILILALMRCRQMLISTVVILIFFLLQKTTSKYLKAMIILVGIAMIFALQNEHLYTIVINGILFAGREKGNLDSLSSGRIVQFKWAIEQIFSNTFIGTGDTRTVDCFYISVFMQYGIILGCLIMVLSLVPLGYGISYYKKTKDPIALILIFCHLSYVIGGLFEENAPYGPGVRCYVSWFLYGYLKMKESRGFAKLQ
ncbi:MAG: hypothetical protein SPE12_13250 [Enterocloster aldenensis]|nr:hypothetical protein [Enterocloster aldenensis]